MNRKAVILVADDDQAHRLLTQEAFHQIGPDNLIRFVNDGMDAIAYLMGEGKYADRNTYAYPSFIITDLKMPNMDGFAVLEHLKANPAWAVIPVIVFSNSNDPDDIRTAYLLGASSYHTKSGGYSALVGQLRVLYDYWMTCQIPEVDVTGKQLRTESFGRLGARFPQPLPLLQVRVARRDPKPLSNSSAAPSTP